MTWYGYAEQDRHYRIGARDRGCTCWADLPAYVHAPACPMYVVPGGTPSGFHDHPGVGSSGGEDRRPLGPPPVADTTTPGSPADDVMLAGSADGANGPGSTGSGPRETMPGGEAVPPGAGDRCWCGSGLRHEHANGVVGHYLDQQHDADDGRPWI